MLNLSQIVFWASAGLLFYVYVGYPALMVLVSLILGSERKPEPKEDELPTISVLIAAHNEEIHIREKIQQTLASDYPPEKMQIVIASDGSTDQTCSIVRSFNDPRVILFEVPQQKGKTNAQNQAMKICTGDVVIFSDATTIYEPKVLRYLASNYKNPKVGAVGGRFRYVDTKGESPTGHGTVVFWNYESMIKSAQSRIQSISGCSGCIYSVRRSVYTPLSPDIISDLVQPLWVIVKGYRVIFEERAMAFEDTTRSVNEEFGMRVRVVTRGMRGILSCPDILKPWKHPWMSLQLFSHKIFRWLVPIFLMTLFASNLVIAGNSSFYRYVLFIQLAFYAAALVSTVVPLHRKWKVLGIPLYFCTLNTAALVSLIQLCRGKKYVVWQTVRS